MTDRDLFASMSDDQLARWVIISNTAHNLTRELAEARSALLAAEVKHVAETADLRGELVSYSDQLAKMSMKRTDQEQANRRLCAAQVQLVRALRTLFDVMNSPAVRAHQFYWPAEVYRAIEDAEEVLRLTEVPF